MSVLLLGNAGAPTRHARAVAVRVAETLATERAAGRVPVVLWLGNMLTDRRGKPDCMLAEQTAAHPLHKVVAQHRARGGASYAVGGVAEFHCGGAQWLASDARPWNYPGVAAIVSVGDRGAASVVLRCNAERCNATPPAEASIVELVLIDTSAWTASNVPATRAPSLLALERMLAAVRTRPAEPPRVLVLHTPIEAAGFHGIGGGLPDATIRTAPPSLREAVVRGQFAGVLAARDRSTYARADLTDGLIRADRAFVERPLFEVVSGAASSPVVRLSGAWQRLRYNSSIALVADRFTPRAGFALVRLGADSSAELHAWGAGRWTTATVALQLNPKSHPTLVRTPSVAPCLRCPRVPVNEQ